ncbi:MAG: hypothetical protein D6734_12030 [Candidatus Schekmanbacteria bacterium]|nr:MAG: hypothetical protein D6734_12030 [Candidatus Schekmanbacteria bacterium]
MVREKVEEMEEEKKEKKDHRKTLKELGDAMVDALISKLPEDVATHLCNSKKEMLLALRGMIDSELRRSEERITKIKEKKSK